MMATVVDLGGFCFQSSDITATRLNIENMTSGRWPAATSRT